MMKMDGLEGRVLNDNKRRTFTFDGSFAEGEFSGTHAEVSGAQVQCVASQSQSNSQLLEKDHW